MKKVIQTSNGYIIRRSEEDDRNEENLITISDIKETLKAIKLLYNNPTVKILVSAGCVDVTPVDKNTEKIDPPIFNEFEVLKINTNTLNVNVWGKEYKTKKLNDSYVYEGKTYYTNMLREVIFKFENN